MPDEYSKKAPRQIRKAFPQDCRVSLADPLPGLTAAEHSAEGATLDPQEFRAFQRDRRIIIAAGFRVVNTSVPFGVPAGLHIDQDLFAILVGLGVDGIPAKIGAARLDPDLALFLFGQPKAERRGG